MIPNPQRTLLSLLNNWQSEPYPVCVTTITSIGRPDLRRMRQRGFTRSKDTPKVHSISLKRVLLTFLLLAGTDAIAQTTAMVVGLLARRSG
jgi:hypothetical protein